LTTFATLRCSQLTSIDSSWGTAGYCAPEQAEDFRGATLSVDIYAFGCILHDLFVGTIRIPYQRYYTPTPIGMVIEKCTETHHEKRFKNISSLRGILLKILAQPHDFTPSPNATEWTEKLQDFSSWNSQQLEEFARFMKSNQDDSDLWSVCQAIDDEVLKKFNSIDNELWLIVASRYCEWAKGSFRFDYCDVIIGRLKIIFELGNSESKAFAAISSAVLGYSHNRWYVMKQVIYMLDSNLDDLVAQRIAIEIRVEDKQKEFIGCAEEVEKDIYCYHPKIAEALDEYKRSLQS
jgi:eukaryotic-like serine/threonine-protein kinase